MKKILTIIYALANLLFASSSFAQAPHKFNYQGIARDVKGNPLANQTMAIKLSVLPTADALFAEYEETQFVNTNEFGLYTLQIGNGMRVSGDMKTVKWETGNKYIRVGIDPKGGDNYQSAGTTQLLSVPYAIYADKAGIAKSSDGSSGSTRASNNYIEKTSAAGVANSNSLLYDNGTSIGLNTISPQARFHISDAAATGGNTELRIQHQNLTSGASRLSFFNDAQTGFSATADYAVLNKYAKGVTGNYATGFKFSQLFSFANSQGSLIFNTAGNIGFGSFLQATSTTITRLFIDSLTGNIGIANSAPTTKLHVHNTHAGDTLKLTNTTTGAGVADGLDIRNVGNAATIMNRENSSLSLGTNNADRIRIDSSGNVGIGTIAPTVRLDVNGQVKISGGTPGLGKVLTSDANGLATWQTPGGGGGGGSLSGTTNYVAKFTSATAAGNSQIFDDGNFVGINNATPTQRLHVKDSIVANGNGIIRGEYIGTSVGTDVVGVYGYSNPANNIGIGVKGEGGKLGVSGIGFENGVFGTLPPGSNGYAVFGNAGSALFGTGVYGFSVGGNGVEGSSSTGAGISAFSNSGVGITSTAFNKAAGEFFSGSSTYSIDLDDRGVIYGEYQGTFAQDAVGVQGKSIPSSSKGIGVAGIGNWMGVYGSSNGTPNYAGYFDGKIYADSATFGIKAFKIDHPLDPANKFLYHSCVESDDMMNIYNGNTVTDANCNATVTLPNYFEVLNKDFRYQLTVIGTFAQAIVSEEVNNNQFKIKTNQPNVKVSWQVTGVRHDPLAEAHRIVPEVEKQGREKGKYISPALYGKPASDGIIERKVYPSNDQLPVTERRNRMK